PEPCSPHGLCLRGQAMTPVLPSAPDQPPAALDAQPDVFEAVLSADVAELAEVDAWLGQLAAASLRGPLRAMVEAHLATGGKKLRARLALSAARALGVPMHLA